MFLEAIDWKWFERAGNGPYRKSTVYYTLISEDVFVDLFVDWFVSGSVLLLVLQLVLLLEKFIAISASVGLVSVWKSEAGGIRWHQVLFQTWIVNGDAIDFN